MAIGNSNKPQTLFPDLPRSPLVNSDGTINMYWQLWFQQLVLTLQTNLKNEGFVIPTQNASDISLLNNEKSLSNILYNNTTNMFNGNILNTETESQEWDQFAMLVFSNGNPNTTPSALDHKSGVFSTFCYDTLGNILYICTVSGNSSTTVWTAI